MKKKRKKNTLQAVDFFCGAGGVTYGFRKAKIEVLGGIDIDSSVKETYRVNNKGAEFLQADVTKLTYKKLKDELGIKRNDDNMIFIGCNPCQYFTLIQTKKSKSKKTRLLLEDFKRFVGHFLPGYVVVENVPGFDTKEDSPLGKFKEFLTEEGYAIDDKVLNASSYNVPQNRRRYVLLASRVNKEIKLPKGRKNTQLTVRNCIGDKKKFPGIEAGHKDTSHKRHQAAKLEEINLKRIRRTRHNGGTRLIYKDDPELQVPCYKGKDNIFTDVYGRMFWDKPAPTITTKFWSISNGRFGHPKQDRAISLREGAALQSFPMSYKFTADTQASIAKMIGNAVPPEMARRIGVAITK